MRSRVFIGHLLLLHLSLSVKAVHWLPRLASPLDRAPPEFVCCKTDASGVTDWTFLAAGSFSTNGSVIADAIENYGSQTMWWANDWNSLDPVAMNTVASGGIILMFLATGPQAIADCLRSGSSTTTCLCVAGLTQRRRTHIFASVHLTTTQHQNSHYHTVLHHGQ
ncbi:hypothetical protein GN244_ATG12830 [Phytophthora infestans]|uniref:Secreted protein n=1 Tax=Phytophthora infestans TaxID=4787 RepID=A0A833SKE8_PHYIN|nr:hypothetical protein GN244_ATG12830 [Phytophthora infestans]